MIKNYRKKPKILIIGAGIAGLAACSRLNDLGYDALILEARDRIGGRIWTNYELTRPMGCGAAWIHGIDNNPIAKLAEHFHVNMVPLEGEDIFFIDRDAKIISKDKITNFDIKFNNLLQLAKKVAFQSKTDISLAQALEKLIENENFNLIEQDLFKRKLRYFEGYLGATYDRLSARYWDQEESWPGQHCFLIDTYQPIIDGIAKNCTIELNSVVTQINKTAQSIEIITKEGKTYFADAVIITVPLGVLKKNKIQFNPSLPHEKRTAIENLEMGLFNITILQFQKAFWPKEYKFMFFANFPELSIRSFFNLYHYIEEPILIGYTGGNTAFHLEKLTDDESLNQTLQNFKSMFKDKVTKPIGYINTRWGEDPYSYGSYSYLKPGATATDYEAMASSIEDRIFFCGEATCSKYSATTHGAYLSGIREAEKIHNNGIN